MASGAFSTCFSFFLCHSHIAEPDKPIVSLGPAFALQHYKYHINGNANVPCSREAVFLSWIKSKRGDVLLTVTSSSCLVCSKSAVVWKLQIFGTCFRGTLTGKSCALSKAWADSCEWANVTKLTSNLRTSLRTVVPILSKSLSYWVTLDSH